MKIKRGWQSKFCYICRDLSLTERFTDLVKPNLIKFDYGWLVLGQSQFSLLPQLPQKKTMLTLEVFKRDLENNHLVTLNL
jgi:hypothetical protein